MPGMECADRPEPGRPAILADLGFAWDPAWLAAIKNHPDNVLMLGDRAVLAHVSAGQDACADQRRHAGRRSPGPARASSASTPRARN